jgi:ribonuclease R
MIKSQRNPGPQGQKPPFKPYREAPQKPAPEKLEIITNYRTGRDGDGYVSDEHDTSYLVPLHQSMGALHRDSVRVQLDPQTWTAQVLEIVSRFKKSYRVRIIESEGKKLALPTDARDGNPISVNTDETEGYALISIDKWDEPRHGIVLQRFTESAGSLGLSSATMRGFESNYSDEVMKEVEELIQNPPTDDFERRDLRSALTFTIDPDTAKDFDDALSIHTENGKTLYGVHIADVSYIVRIGTKLDQSAQERATSVYLPGATHHMLPPLLAESFCSLRPNEERRTMSVLFELDDQGIPQPVWIGPAWIKSDHRYTYEEVDEIMEKGSGIHHDELIKFNDIALRMEAIRKARGALFLASTEVKPRLDENGFPIAFTHNIRTQSHALIEEWMLMANEATARRCTELQRGIYRAHPAPSEDRLYDLAQNLQQLGIKTSFKELLLPGALTRVLDQNSKEETLTSILAQMMAQTQEKAFYTTEHIGHSGLAMDTYTHFTSPIRRYPDVLVHRAIKQSYSKENYFPYSQPELQALLDHATQQERAAQQSEREAISIAHAQYWSTRSMQPLQVLVRSISRAGVFGSEVETLADGRFNTFDRTKYSLDIEKHELYDKRNKIVIKPGMFVKAFVRETNVPEGQITFEFLK